MLIAVTKMERDCSCDVMRTSAEDFFLRLGPQQVQFSKADFSKLFLKSRGLPFQGTGLLLKKSKFKVRLV